VIAVVVAVVIAGGMVYGYNAVLRGSPRPLVGKHSVLLRDEWDVRFARVPEQLPAYEWAAAKVRGSGAHRVGIMIAGDQWEYPWWVMLPGTEFVSLTSILPHHPSPPSNTVEAILCVGPPDSCRALVPSGWRFEVRDGWFGVAVPGQPAQ
jgi:hypothetical protein